MKIAELAWIDGFWRQARPYLFVREEDRLIILPPSRVYRLNDTGLALLAWLGRGRRIARFPGLASTADGATADGATADGVGERADQVHAFFRDLRAFWLGCAGDGDGRRAVERVPYTFDYTRLPVLGEIAVTYRCNHRCLFCYAGCGGETLRVSGSSADGTAPVARGGGRCRAGEAAPRGTEMTLPEVRRVLRVFRDRARLPFFSFTGGEPLLRGDLENMIRCAVRLGLRVNLITNGTLADPARAARLHRAGLRSAQVSLESAEEAVHDRLTCTPGSFRSALAGMRSLQEAGIAVQTNTTLNRLNAGGAEALPAFLEGIGVRRFAMNLFIPAGSGRAHDELLLPYRETGAVIERVRRQARQRGLEFSWYSPIPHCLYNPVARGLGNKSCAAVDGLLSVSPAGQVLPCSSWPEPIGDLLRQPFEAIWFSERARWFKRKRYAPAECAGCDRFTACQSACPLYWRHVGTGEIAEARITVPVAPGAVPSAELRETRSVSGGAP